MYETRLSKKDCVYVPGTELSWVTHKGYTTSIKGPQSHTNLGDKIYAVVFSPLGHTQGMVAIPSLNRRPR